MDTTHRGIHLRSTQRPRQQRMQIKKWGWGTHPALSLPSQRRAMHTPQPHLLIHASELRYTRYRKLFVVVYLRMGPAPSWP